MYKIINILIPIVFILISHIFSFGNESANITSIKLKAENGNAYSQGILGEIYRRGEMGEINFEKAYKWLKLSSAQNNPIGLYNLAILYNSGTFVTKDTIHANKLFRKAHTPMLELAEQGNSRAQLNMGYMLFAGNGISKNLPEALKWIEKAANANNSRAQFFFGYIYYTGRGLEKDYSKAKKWFTRSASNHFPAAQHFLGNMYVNGYGVTKSYKEASQWHRKAEKNQTNKEKIYPDSSFYILNGIKHEGDKIIPGLLPSQFILEIPEGSCGESCLWSIINSKYFVASQIEINFYGGYPGRGLHVNEIHKPLDQFKIKYYDNLDKSYFKYAISFLNPKKLFYSYSKRYKDFLYKNIIPRLEQGNPIILGIKIYPDKHFFWDSDHFILLVGYNEKTNEIIYNDFNKRKRIKVDKLLDKSTGYSIINKYNFLNYLEILDFQGFSN